MKVPIPVLILGIPCALVATLLTGYAVAVNVRIHVQARQLAHGQPYCLMVATEYQRTYKGITSTYHGYEIADSPMDTIGLLMMGGKSVNHAMLVTGYRGNQFQYHWSYWNFGFRKGALTHGETCAKYKYDYAHLQPADFRDTTSFRFAGRTFDIPVVYQRKLSLDDPRTGMDESTFRVITTLFDFKPTRDRCPAHDVCQQIRVSTPEPRNADERLSGDKSTRTLFGLHFQPNANTSALELEQNPEPHTPWGLYYQKNKQGRVSTFIRCLSWCDITFDKNGLRYFFTIESAQLPHWKAYTKKVADFIEGFEHSKTTPSPTATRHPPKPMQDAR